MNKTINVNMIVLGREFRGFTQNELATEIDVYQGALSKMESGFAEVTEEILNKIATKLNLPLPFFYQSGNIYPLGSNFYRKNKDVPKKVLVQIEAELNVRRMQVQKLLDAAEIDKDKIKHLEVDGDKYMTASQIAIAIRECFNIPRGPIENMTKIIEDVGIIVIHCDFGTRKFSGSRVITEKGNYIIFVNANMPGDRLRFTLAHEFGHIIMHNIPSEKMEEEADEFASEFLMPTLDVRSQLSRLTFAKLGLLKKHWKVSMAALIMRATQLRTITEVQRGHLWTNMGRRGYRIEEPIELNIMQEKPTLIKEIIDLHYGELGYVPQQLIELLAMNEEEYLKWYTDQKPTLKLIRVR